MVVPGLVAVVVLEAGDDVVGTDVVEEVGWGDDVLDAVVAVVDVVAAVVDVLDDVLDVVVVGLEGSNR